MIRLLLSIIIITIFLTGCSTGLFSVHKIDIQQGNSLTEADLEKIETGMQRKEVLAALGQPILSPVLSNDRWEYVYYLKEPDVAVVTKQLTIVFSDDEVKSLIQ